MHSEKAEMRVFIEDFPLMAPAISVSLFNLIITANMICGSLSEVIVKIALYSFELCSGECYGGTQGYVR